MNCNLYIKYNLNSAGSAFCIIVLRCRDVNVIVWFLTSLVYNLAIFQLSALVARLTARNRLCVIGVYNYTVILQIA